MALQIILTIGTGQEIDDDELEGDDAPLVENGTDFSDYFLSCHVEQTTSETKDEQKYDVTLANINGQLFEKFKPKTPMHLEVLETADLCEGEGSSDRILIFDGEIQNVATDEMTCNIQGSCNQGGMVGALKKDLLSNGKNIPTLVEELLDEYGEIKGERHIHPKNRDHPSFDKKWNTGDDYDTVIQELAELASSIWYLDEKGDFWFVPPAALTGAIDLTDYVLEGQTASTMIGLCTVVNVVGGSAGAKPDNPASVIKTKAGVHAQARADQDTIDEYGEIYAPTIFKPNADQQTCQNIADNALAWFKQYKDVPQVKICKKAPLVRSKVSYRPFNGVLPANRCTGEKGGSQDIEMSAVVGSVSRRVVDISADNGLVCTLDVSTNFEDGLPEDENGNPTNSDIFNSPLAGVVLATD